MGKEGVRQLKRPLTWTAAALTVALVCCLYWTGSGLLERKCTEALERIQQNGSDDPWPSLVVQAQSLSPEDLYGSQRFLGEEKRGTGDAYRIEDTTLRWSIGNYYEVRQQHRGERVPLYWVHLFHQDSYWAWCYVAQDSWGPDGAAGALGAGDWVVFIDVSTAMRMLQMSTGVLVLVGVALTLLVGLAERRLVQTQERARQRERDFFANASHELRAPLMSVGGYADALEDGLVPLNEAASSIRSEAQRMEGLVSQILALAKADAGKVPVRAHRCDVRELVYEALGVEGIEGMSEKRVTVDAPEPLPFVCDPDLTFSTVSNLVTNAWRHAASCVRVEARVEEGRLCVRVSNDGDTIAPERVEELFERFHTGPGGQTGLGLALAREYARLQGGDVTASVEAGRTCMVVSLPEGKACSSLTSAEA